MPGMAVMHTRHEICTPHGSSPARGRAASRGAVRSTGTADGAESGRSGGPGARSPADGIMTYIV